MIYIQLKLFAGHLCALKAEIVSGAIFKSTDSPIFCTASDFTVQHMIITVQTCAAQCDRTELHDD